MIINEQTLKRVRDLGALGHTPSEIAFLLDISLVERDAFIDEFSRPDTNVYAAYRKGRAMMNYNTNVELANAAERGDTDAIALLDKRKQDQKVNDVLYECFGI